MAVVSPTPSRSIVAVGRGALPDSVFDQCVTEYGRAVAAQLACRLSSDKRFFKVFMTVFNH
jgi:hypothetical protein